MWVWVCVLVAAPPPAHSTRVHIRICMCYSTMYIYAHDIALPFAYGMCVYIYACVYTYIQHTPFAFEG